MKFLPGAWQATVDGVAKNQTQLSAHTTHVLGTFVDLQRIKTPVIILTYCIHLLSSKSAQDPLHILFS